MRNFLSRPALGPSAVVFMLVLAGCGGKEEVTVSGDDTGTVEDGSVDTGTSVDTGGPPVDSSVPPGDTTITPDGTPVDTGTPPTDTGTVIPPVDGGCPSGLSICGAACIDLTKDMANCGACGKLCASGGTCISGVCNCPTGEIICGGKCVDVTKDPANCGACGKSCGSLGTCTSGVCGCPTGGTSCAVGGGGTVCVDITKDPKNCAGCGKTCGVWGSCTSSSCACPSGTSLCSTGGGGGGGTIYCADTLENSRFCGKTGCGTYCGDRDYCDGAGTCACKPGLTACTFGGGSTCLNTNGSPNACGGCGTVCAGGQTCVAGKCVASTGGTPPACPTGQTRCAFGGGGGNAGCYDLTKDNTACGACGNTCATNELCVAGACKPFAVAPTCTTCPCADCATWVAGGGEGASCCPSLPGHKHALCVRGAACPK